MRSKNTMRNALTSVVGQVVVVVLSFISRTVFVKTLGAQYVGVNGLFTNIISVLNITELGLGTAIVYSMYHPVAHKEYKKIQANMNYLRKAYLFVGTFILVIGLIFLPFVPYIVNDNTLSINVNLIYIMYLFQTVLSYWCFAYKSAILQADQKQYISAIFTTFVRVITSIIQIIILLTVKSFILYLVVGIFSSLVYNILVLIKVNKIYPYLKEKNQEELTNEEKHEIKRNILGLSMYKISGTVLDSTDNIVISSFIGLFQVGLYSNYLLITSSIRTLTQILFNSFTASIGNLNVTESSDKSEFIFRCLNFLNFWIYGFCSISLYVLLNPFISLWLGSEYLFNKTLVIIIVLNFLTEGLQQAVITYKDACGLFWIGRYRPIFSATLNILFSIMLVRPLGVSGVLLATIISRFLTTWWFDARMVHKHVFYRSPKKYFIRYIVSLVTVIAVAILTEFFCSLVPGGYWLNFICKCIMCVLIPNVIFFLLFNHKEEFNYIFNAVKNVLSKR